MKYFIKIFGCQMNYSDAERISGFLNNLGLREVKADLPAEAIAKAGFVIFVTCGVRQMAEDRVYGLIHNIKKQYPNKSIILTGCLAKRKDVRRRLKDKVDLFCEIKDFPKEIINVVNVGNGIPAAKSKLFCDYLSITPKSKNSYTAYVPIMTGCNNFCAYCVVPYARGREYSRPANDILREVKGLLKNGCKEIVLLGQNVNSYRDIAGKQPLNFARLLEKICALPGNFWLTYLTSHPKDMSDQLIETIAKNKKICEYVSLPAQAGDDITLMKMNRRYTVAHYKKLVKKIRFSFAKFRPQDIPAISTDIIVGFPGETKKQFENTAKLLRELKFDMAYIAQYSPRPETAAWKLKDNVSKKEKVRREKILTAILNKTSLANNKNYIGKIEEVLVDKIIPGSPGALKRINKCSGHTRTQKKVILFSNKKIPVGKFAKVKLTRARAFGLEGNVA